MRTSGVDLELEEQANEILRADRGTIMNGGGWHYRELNDWFSESQMKNRWRHEIQVSSGTPDASLFSGVFGRVHNPLARTEIVIQKMANNCRTTLADDASVWFRGPGVWIDHDDFDRTQRD